MGQIIKVRNNKQLILGPEWSMSEVGNPPSHNPYKPHGLVASINKIINILYFELQFLFKKREVNKFLG